MADLLSWFGHRIKDAENGIGGFVNGAASTVNDAVNNVSRAVNQPERRPQVRPPQVGVNAPQPTPTLRPPAPNVASRPQGFNPVAPLAGIGKNIGDFANGFGHTVGDVGNTVGHAVNDFVVKPVVDSANTVGNAYASGINYLGGELNGSHAAQQQQIMDVTRQAAQNKIKAVTAPSQYVAAPSTVNQQQLLRQSQAQENIANTLKQQQAQQIADVRANNDPVKVGAASVSLLSTVAAPGMSKIATPVANFTRPVLGNVGSRIVGNAISQAPVGAVLGATGQIQQTGTQTTLPELINAAGMGALGGAVLGGAAPEVASLAGKALKPAAVRAQNFGLKPPTKLTPEELAASSKVVQAQNNPVNPVSLTTQDMQLYRKAQSKLGQKPGTPDAHQAVVGALNAHRAFDVAVEQRRQATLGALENSSQFAQNRLIPGGTLKNLPNDPLQALKLEALKYNTPGDFVDSQTSKFYGVDGQPGDQKFLASLIDKYKGVVKPGDKSLVKYFTPEEKARYNQIMSPENNLSHQQLTDLYNQAHGIQPTAKPVATPAVQTGNLSKVPSSQGKLPPKELTAPQIPQPNLTSGSRRVTSVTPEMQATTSPLPQIQPQGGQGMVELPKLNPSKTRIQQKAPIVDEARRAINGNDTSSYGLRDSFNAKDNVPPELKDALGAFGNTRTVKSNKELWQKAQQRVGEDVSTAMDFYKSNHNDDAVATGYALINRYMKQGNTKEAGALAMDMAERALESGRTTQAYALMKRLTPEGQITYVEKKIARFKEQNPDKASKLNWDDNKRQQLYKMAEDINKMPEGHDRNLAIGKMQQLVDNIFPSSIKDKAITVWKAGLLTSLRTHERNIVSNAINIGSELSSQAPASLADRLMSLRTGQRTIVNAPVAGLSKGAGVGKQLAKDQIKTGIDTTSSNLKYNINHITWNSNKVERALKTYTESVFRPLGAEDKLFKEAARSNSLYNQAKANGVTKGLKGRALQDFTKKQAENPTAKMLDIAEQDAGRSTFAHDNHLAEIIKNAKAAVRRSNKPGSEAASAALDILMPFTQVPSGVASQLYAYSPVKLMKSTYDIGKVLITGNKDLQREAARGFGRSVIGTSVLGAGAYLASQGLMTGQPKDDAEKAQWQSEGKQPNSVKVGDRWYPIGSIGPQAILALAGGQMVADGNNGDNAVGNLAANIGKNLKDQTFLKGMSSALDAIDDPKRYAQSFVESQATSVIPNLVKDIARAFDPNDRQANGIIDRAKQGIPGLSTSLPKKYDSFGQEVKNSGALELVDLFNSSQQKDIPEAKYIDALRQATGTKEHVPTIADKTITVNGQNMKLDSQQYSDYQKYIGQYSKDIIGKAMASGDFQNLPKDEQVKRIDNALKDINAKAKSELFGNMSKNKLKDPASELSTEEKAKKTANNRKISARRSRRGGGRSSTGVVAGKQLVNLTKYANGIRPPKTTGSKAPSLSIRQPQLKKVANKKFNVRTAKVSGTKKQAGSKNSIA